MQAKMPDKTTTRLILIRHAPALSEGRQCGRTDVGADCTAVPSQHTISRRWGTVEHVVTSPARRCVETVEALWATPDTRPGVSVEPRLWEQDFGDWEGLPVESLPDLGELSSEELAKHRPPNGESFWQVYDRVGAAIDECLSTRTGQTVCICAHAGPIRAAVGLALKVSPGRALRLQVDCLSATVLCHFGRDQWAVEHVNTEIGSLAHSGLEAGSR